MADDQLMASGLSINGPRSNACDYQNTLDERRAKMPVSLTRFEAAIIEQLKGMGAWGCKTTGGVGSTVSDISKRLMGK